jgi:antitoxin (DNA-binding transcriptional repressor) of toxin-antitoxin stability system
MTYTIPLTEAASQLADIVHRLRQNDTIVLLENDVPVANITPPHQMNTILQASSGRKELADSFVQMRQELLAHPNYREISDEEIQEEIDAYRRGE